jgi:hypothetical protein
VIEPEQVVGRELLVLAAAIVHNLNRLARHEYQ